MDDDTFATTLIVKASQRLYRVKLRRPMTAGELWQHFVSRVRCPKELTLSKGVARVTFGPLAEPPPHCN